MRFSTAIIFKDNDVARARYKRAAAYEGKLLSEWIREALRGAAEQSEVRQGQQGGREKAIAKLDPNGRLKRYVDALDG